MEIAKNIFHEYDSNYIFDKCVEAFHNMTKDHTEILGQFLDFTDMKIGRASCRERVLAGV